MLTASPPADLLDAKASIHGTQPPLNPGEGLVRIEALQERLRDHVQFIRDLDSLTGVSTEGKVHAVTAFYERLLHLDKPCGG